MTENITFKYPYKSSLRERVISIIILLKEPALNEIIFEIAELQGIASEEGIAECIVSVEEILEELIKENKILPVNNLDDIDRYKLSNKE